MNGCRLIGLKWIIRLSEGVLFSIIYNLLQFFPIARHFHLILNRNPPIRNARQRVRNNLARPVSDAVQFRQFSFDFFEFRKKGFAFCIKLRALCFQRRALLLIEMRRKPQQLYELFAQPDCFLQSVQWVKILLIVKLFQSCA